MRLHDSTKYYHVLNKRPESKIMFSGILGIIYVYTYNNM